VTWAQEPQSTVLVTVLVDAKMERVGPSVNWGTWTRTFVQSDGEAAAAAAAASSRAARAPVGMARGEAWARMERIERMSQLGEGIVGDVDAADVGRGVVCL
jgi:hypothetical protein